LAGDNLNPREHPQSRDTVSLRRILPLLGGEGRGEGGRIIFPQELKLPSNQSLPRNMAGEILAALACQPAIQPTTSRRHIRKSRVQGAASSGAGSLACSRDNRVFKPRTPLQVAAPGDGPTPPVSGVPSSSDEYPYARHSTPD
jgi:hypothetical protein